MLSEPSVRVPIQSDAGITTTDPLNSIHVHISQHFEDIVIRAAEDNVGVPGRIKVVLAFNFDGKDTDLLGYAKDELPSQANCRASLRLEHQLRSQARESDSAEFARNPIHQSAPAVLGANEKLALILESPAVLDPVIVQQNFSESHGVLSLPTLRQALKERLELVKKAA